MVSSSASCLRFRARRLMIPLPPVFAGILRLELDKATYERAGLVGKAIRGGGRKHLKERFGSVLTIPSIHLAPLCVCMYACAFAMIGSSS